jgi:hypothetical protein
MKHDPLFYIITHGRGLLLCWALYIISLICIQFQYDANEAAMLSVTAMMAFYGTWGSIEAISFWYRHNWMESPFTNYPVVVKLMLSMSDVEVARGLAYELAVMPSTKAHTMYVKWWDEVRAFWTINSFTAVCFCITFIIISSF